MGHQNKNLMRFLLIAIAFLLTLPSVFCDGTVYFFEERTALLKSLYGYDQVGIVEYDGEKEKMTIINDFGREEIIKTYVGNVKIFPLNLSISSHILYKETCPEPKFHWIVLEHCIEKYGKISRNCVYCYNCIYCWDISPENFYEKIDKKNFTNIFWVIPIETKYPKQIKLDITETNINLEFIPIEESLRKVASDVTEATVIRPLTSWLDLFTFYIGAAGVSEEVQVKKLLTIKKYGIALELIPSSENIIAYLSKFGNLTQEEKEMLEKLKSDTTYFIVGYIEDYTKIPITCEKVREARWGLARDLFFKCQRRANIEIEFIPLDNKPYYPLLLMANHDIKIAVYAKGAYKGNYKGKYGRIGDNVYTKFEIDSNKIKDDLYLLPSNSASILIAISDNLVPISVTIAVLLLLFFLKFNRGIKKVAFFVAIPYIFGFILSLLLDLLEYHPLEFLLLICIIPTIAILLRYLKLRYLKKINIKQVIPKTLVAVGMLCLFLILTAIFTSLLANIILFLLNP